MSAITNLCYQIDCCYKSAEIGKEINAIEAELSECQKEGQRWNDKLADLQDKKDNKEYYSIFDMKRYENKVKMYDRMEAALNKKKTRLQTSNTCISAMEKGFEEGASDSSIFSFQFK